MLRFHLLENFSDLGAGEMDQLYKHEDRVLAPVPILKSQVWAREMTQWLRSSQEPLAHIPSAHRRVPLFREP